MQRSVYGFITQMGQAPVVLLTLALLFVLPIQNAQAVQVNSWSQNHFDISSGVYRIHYALGGNDDLILMQRGTQSKQMCLDFGLGTLGLLSTGNFQSLNLVETSEAITVVLSSSPAFADFEIRQKDYSAVWSMPAVI